ncbi:Maltose O-acetyltransferase [compost metagenome]
MQELASADRLQITRLSFDNAIRESSDSLSGTALAHAAGMCRMKLERNHRKVKGLLASQRFDHLIVPGGVYGNTGLFLWEAQSHGVRATTYDAGLGEMFLGMSSPAAHLMDMRDFVKSLLEQPIKREVVDSLALLAQAEYQARRSATDNVEYQTVASTGGWGGYDVIIPLNINFDTAVLDKHSVFSSRSAWVEETVGFILEHTQATVAVREHPAQRIYRSGAHLERALTQRFGAHSRFRFIGCDERVNTYDMLEEAKVVLPFSSTVGIEAAAMGKYVLVESNAYYADLPFVERARSKQEYFAKIRAALEVAPVLPRELQSQAWIAYLASHYCSRVPTHFTPNPEDFERWSQQGIVDLLRDPGVELVIDTLTSGRHPASILLNRLLAKHFPHLPPLSLASDNDDPQESGIQDPLACFLANAPERACFETSMSALDDERLLAAESCLLGVFSDRLDLVAQLGELYQAHPESPPLSLWAGLAFFAVSRHSEAIRAFHLAKARGLHHWRIDWYLAKSALQMGETKVACELVLEVMVQAPWFKDAHLLLDELAEQIGDPTWYRNILESGAARSRSSIEILKRLGLAAFATGQIPIAEQAFRQVLTLDQWDLDALISLGDLSISARRYSEALNYFQSAVSIDAHETDALAGLILAAKQLQADELLISSAELLREMAPEHPVLAELSLVAAEPLDKPLGLVDAFPNVTFGHGVQLLGIRNIVIGRGSCVGDQVWLNICERDSALRMRIGECVLVGRQSMISTGGYLEIGSYCVLAPRVYISDADHVFADINQPILQQGATMGRSLVVEENCWFGINTVATGNFTIGRGSIIAANAVVTKEVPPFALVAGNPARIIKLYNPRTGGWERVQNKEDEKVILADRQVYGIPSRLEYQEILRRNNRLTQVDPIVAGRGEHIW